MRTVRAALAAAAVISIAIFVSLSTGAAPLRDGIVVPRVTQRDLARQAAYRPVHPANSIASAATDASALLFALDVGTAISASVTGDARQYAAFSSLGAGLTPSHGSSFAFLSTGVAGAGTPATLDPAATGVESGTDFGLSCGGLSDHDCVDFTFSFVAPPGAHSLKFDFNFMSAEYPEFVGTDFNDEFSVAETSTSHTYSNVVFDGVGNPVNINSAFFNEPCTSLPQSGFDIMSDFGNGCDAGATGLLTTQAPIEPGETVTLSFSLRDRGDGIYDSAVMFDNFTLSTEMVPGPSTNGQIGIDYLSPKSGPVAGGTQVMIYGTGFVAVTSVAFDGTPALFQTLDATSILAITPPGTEGPVSVSVTGSPGGSPTTGAKANGFIYYQDPSDELLTVEQVDPAEGPAQGGVYVVVKGSGFTPESHATFGGEPGEDVQFISGDQILVRTPAGSGAADVRVTNADGTSATLGHGYTYLGNPAGAKTGGCSCDLGAGMRTGGAGGTDLPGSAAAAAGAAVLALVLWRHRRREESLRPARACAGTRSIAPLAIAAAIPAVLVASGCENSSHLAQVNAPPTADAGPDQEAFIGDAITLDGTGSHDFELGAVTYAWQIVSQPDGSVASLDDASAATPHLIADKAGLYRIGLIVTDSSGTESDPIGYGPDAHDNLTNVIALPFRNLDLTLDWDADLADLDLHLIRDPLPAGYFDEYRDCYFGVPDPDWGSAGVHADDPVLDQDDDDGFGPEHVSLPSPSDAGVYSIVVHEFNAHGAGPTTAHVVLSVDGATLAEVFSNQPLSGTDAVWVVGTLAWPDDVFTEQNLITTHQALNGPTH